MTCVIACSVSAETLQRLLRAGMSQTLGARIGVRLDSTGYLGVNACKGCFRSRIALGREETATVVASQYDGFHVHQTLNSAVPLHQRLRGIVQGIGCTSHMCSYSERRQTPERRWSNPNLTTLTISWFGIQETEPDSQERSNPARRHKEWLAQKSVYFKDDAFVEQKPQFFAAH